MFCKASPRQAEVARRLRNFNNAEVPRKRSQFRSFSAELLISSLEAFADSTALSADSVLRQSRRPFHKLFVRAAFFLGEIQSRFCAFRHTGVHIVKLCQKRSLGNLLTVLRI